MFTYKNVFGVLILCLFVLFWLNASDLAQQRKTALAAMPQLERQVIDVKRAAAHCEYLLAIHDQKAVECATTVTKQANELTAKINSYMPH